MIVDFERSKQIAFEEISKFEDVIILNSYHKRKHNYSDELTVWELSTEIYNSIRNCIDNLVLHVVLLKDFPLSHPKIYFSKVSFDKFGYLPHVDSKRFICTFDTENTRTDVLNPVGIIYQSIQKAKRIITEGLSCDNLSEYENEFVAYWEQKYSRADSVAGDILWLVENGDSDFFEVLILKKRFHRYNVIVVDNNEYSLNIKAYLSEIGCSFDIVKGLNMGCIDYDIKPPVIFANRVILNIVSNLDFDIQERFKYFIKSKLFPKFIFFKKIISTTPIYLGLVYNEFDFYIKGFRSNVGDYFSIIQGLHLNSPITRILPQVFTRNRLTKRTAGNIKSSNSYEFLIAGLGSIGSNLLYFLNSYDKPNFKLVDFDNLELENLGRHFLGISNIGFSKVKGLRNYLLDNFPLQNVSFNEGSIVEVINNDLNYVNSSDYIFISIGKYNVEKFIADSLELGLIKKPIFFLWLEPYLAGGHCLFIHPNDKVFSSFFNDLGIFKYNVIEENEYLNNNDLFSLTEAGCHSKFVPYSYNNVVLFLSQMFSKIHFVIENKYDRSVAYSWIGNKQEILDIGIKLSGFGVAGEFNHIYENKT